MDVNFEKWWNESHKGCTDTLGILIRGVAEQAWMKAKETSGPAGASDKSLSANNLFFEQIGLIYGKHKKYVAEVFAAAEKMVKDDLKVIAVKFLRTEFVGMTLVDAVSLYDTFKNTNQWGIDI